MKALRTIFKRELASYFNSPIAYVFILVFLTVSTALFLFLPPFFTFPRAEMTDLFGWLVPVLCVFIPAATMRIWAEERKENTLEMLLTFPVKPAVLVLGKYGAAMVFYLVALACTWLIPVMLAVLGNPDSGPLLAGYFGAILLGAFFVAMGTFISGLCKDQVIAFVLSFLACVAVSLFGWDTFATILDGTLAGSGTLLQRLVGMTNRYLPFTRGVVEISGVLYFLLWTVLFLFLNATYLEGRRRPHLRAVFSLSVVLCVAIGVLFGGVTAETNLGSVDLTQDKIYTVSPATRDILSHLKVPVQVKLYITPSDKMPGELKDLERDVMAKLREMEVTSKGKLRPAAVHMEAGKVLADEETEGKTDDKKKSLEGRLMEKGIRPFPIQALREDQSTTQLVYSSIGVGYLNKDEEIIPQVVPQSLPELEYRIVSAAYKLTRDKAPVVAMVAPTEEVKIPPYMLQLYQQMGRPVPKTDDPYSLLERVLRHEKYDVRRVQVSKESPLPDDYDALAIINPQQLNARQKWEVNRAMVEGKATFMAVQNYRWNYSVNGDKVSVEKRNEEPGINEFLEPSGLQLSDDILMDANHEPLTISDQNNPLEGMMGGGMTLDLPMQIVVTPMSMNQSVSITERLGSTFYLWGSALKLSDDKLKENKITHTVLIQTSPRAWMVPASRPLRQSDLEPPEKVSQYPLAVLAKGQFADKYPGDKRPGWPKAPPPGVQGPPPEETPESEPAPPARLKAGKLILIGDAEMFRKNFLSRGNLDLFMNSMDALTLGEKLIEVRSKKPVDRRIGRIEEGKRTFWKAMLLGFMNCVVAAAGITRAALLRSARDRYRAEREERV